MDYRIYEKAADFRGTGYIKIVRVARPEVRSGQAIPESEGAPRELGQDGSLLIDQEAFFMADGIIAKHFEKYGHFGPNEIPREIGLKITAEWEKVAALMAQMTTEQIYAALNLGGAFAGIWPGQVEAMIPNFVSEIEDHRGDIARFLLSLAKACNAFYRDGDWIYIEGV
jgi:hypothetical protein